MRNGSVIQEDTSQQADVAKRLDRISLTWVNCERQILAAAAAGRLVVSTALV